MGQIYSHFSPKIERAKTPPTIDTKRVLAKEEAFQFFAFPHSMLYFFWISDAYCSESGQLLKSFYLTITILLFWVMSFSFSKSIIKRLLLLFDLIRPRNLHTSAKAAICLIIQRNGRFPSNSLVRMICFACLSVS